LPLRIVSICATNAAVLWGDASSALKIGSNGFSKGAEAI